MSVATAQRTCMYLWAVRDGAMLGLPVEEVWIPPLVSSPFEFADATLVSQALEYTSEGALNVIGFGDPPPSNTYRACHPRVQMIISAVGAFELTCKPGRLDEELSAGSRRRAGRRKGWGGGKGGREGGRERRAGGQACPAESGDCR